MTVTADTAVKRPRPEKTPEETVAGIRRQIPALERRAYGEDPWMAAEMWQLAEELKAATVRVVADMRYPDPRYPDPRTGAPGPRYRWEDIGFAFGITGLTALKRWKAETDRINEARRAAEKAEAEAGIEVE
jgi:hypothetical protein